MSESRDPIIQALLDNMDCAYDRPGWQGANLTQALASVPETAREFRAAPDEPSIWEYLVHAAYWKFVVYARASQSDEPFGEDGHDFFTRPNGVATWESDLAALARRHGLVKSVVESWPVESLHNVIEGYETTTAFGLFIGIAAHDCYHAGQIEMLKRLCGSCP